MCKNWPTGIFCLTNEQKAFTFIQFWRICAKLETVQLKQSVGKRFDHLCYNLIKVSLIKN